MTYKSVNHLTPVDAAYIAGIIDGEGTITLSKRHRNENRQLVISVSSNDKKLLQFLMDSIGAGKITGKRVYSTNHQPSYSYSISNRQALDLLKQTITYLRTYKKQRAELVIDHYIDLTPRNGKYTDELSQKREKFISDFFEILAD